MRTKITFSFLLLLLSMLVWVPTMTAQSDDSALPTRVTIAGTLQDELGCEGEWQPECEATALTFDEDDQLWIRTFALSAGDYEYKVALNGSWDVNYGMGAEPDGANIPLSLAEDGDVTFLFDHVTGWVMDDVNGRVYTVPGDFQDEIGCPGDWQPDCLRSWLQDSDGDGFFTFATTAIPTGDYEAKVAADQNWTVNWGDAGAQDGPNIPFNVPADDTLVTFVFDSMSGLLTIGAGEAGGPVMMGNLGQQQAYWVTADTIAWEIDTAVATDFAFYYNPAGNALALTPDGVTNGEALPLRVNPEGLGEAVIDKFPHLQNLTALTLAAEDVGKARIALKGQTAVAATDAEGNIVDATGLQIPGVLDDLYRYDGPLGITLVDGVPTLRLWAPTARSVKLKLYADSNPETRPTNSPMRIDPDTGVWEITGEPAWVGQYYLYEVEVYAPTTGQVEVNVVTDPYALSLSLNSQRSQIVDLNDATLMPDGWAGLAKPALAAPEDIVVYELHVRDFSVNDPTVPEAQRGTYLAFTNPDTDGMRHLINLSEAGLTHLHLLPTFDIATIDEDKANWSGPTFAELAAFASDSEEQQALINESRDADPFNWGYDPWHYNVPEGSYASDANGPTRILEYRQMVQALNEAGLRLVIDVVYNHTNSAGQAEKSVLDRIVPGYYHRLNSNGKVETSTCCQNTATEHDMMRKLMIDSVLIWATAYKVDAFRFDLMGHHMRRDMELLREALDSLTVEQDGVDGSNIYVYGEGWNFGEVGDNARGINATQFNMAGTGIGTFNDRLRDAVRGGNPFGGQTEQGFINGLYYDPNAFDQGTEAEQLERLNLFADQIRVGLAGNLQTYEFVSSDGVVVTGLDIDYNGSPAGYTLDPQENIVYISKHDNETLFDIIQFKAPLDSSLDERTRMQNMGLSIVMLSQGVPFFHAGSDMLRSKSLDRNSYNSGDWFNRLDFSYETNYFGAGLPTAADNEGVWEIMQPILAAEGLTPGREQIVRSVEHFQEFLQIRQSSPLFRLRTAAEVQERLQFHNSGSDQRPGLIVMSISDMVGGSLDDDYGLAVVLFNANSASQTFTEEALLGLPLVLHPVLAESTDGVVKTAVFDVDTATFTIPARTTAVFVLPEADTPVTEPVVEAVQSVAEAVEEVTEDVVEESTEEARAESGEELTPEQDEAHSPATTDGPSAGMIVGWALALGTAIAGGAALLARQSRQKGHDPERH